MSLVQVSLLFSIRAAKVSKNIQSTKEFAVHSSSFMAGGGASAMLASPYPLPSAPHIILLRRVLKKMWLLRFTTFI